MNPYQAIPAATVYVEAVCSRTGAPIAFVGKGEWGTDQICRWYCREIALQSELASAINTGRRVSGFTESETIRSVAMLTPAACPTCGDSSLKYFRCGSCQTLNCYGSVHETKLGKWWHLKRKVAVVSTCGACRRSTTGMSENTVMTMAAIRDTGRGHDESRPPSKETGLTKVDRHG